MNETFDKLRRRARQQWHALQQGPQPRILVGTATCGRSAGAEEVRETFRRQLADRALQGRLIDVGCLGLCYAEPIVWIAKPGRPMICYGHLTPDRAAELVEAYLLGDDPLPAYALGTIGEGSVAQVPDLFQTPVFKPQVRRTLRHCGFIDPTDIDHYLAHDGYSGLVRALELGPAGIIEELKRSGLRGRGGAGFPTWRKWQTAREAKGPTKYIICNGSEGDPGVFSNRLLLESDPHAVLEGMLIAAYAVGADEGVVYCPTEYPLARERLRTALEQMEDCRLLGDAVLGSSFGLHLKIKEGAGAYICGEESALIGCIEGRRGIPRLRPPFPPVCGLWGQPTIVHNVETLACVAQILRRGAPWFAELGTENSKGTKLLCLSGNVRHGGVFEVPLGSTLREVVFGIGGGTSDGKAVKAVQVGGPAGGCLLPEHCDLPLDQDSLLPYGASLGSGGLIVLDEDTCLVDLARNMLHFAARESCGQCAPCRLGTQQMFEIVNDITEGRGAPGDLELLAGIGTGLKTAALCGLGQAAANPMLATVRYFREEWEKHLAGNCPAGVCCMSAAARSAPTGHARGAHPASPR